MNWRATLLALGLVALPLSGQPQDAEKAADAKATADLPKPRMLKVERSLDMGGETIDYTVRAGEMFLDGEDGEPAASIFSISYIRSDVDDARERPVTFVWNGGPGSSSVWLHMGAFGPLRVITPSDATDVGAPPYPVEENLNSLLDVTDLVFIDPVGTGYSKVLGDTDPKDYWGLHEDAESVADFIRLWITKHKRWNSPKYIAGESYGGTRAAAITEKLQGGWNGIALNGVILISPALDFATLRFTRSNDIAPVGYFPSWAATAWYHGKVDKDRWDGDFQRFIDDARGFAVDEYLPALMRGTSMSEREMEVMARRVSGYIGLSTDYLMNVDLRVGSGYFKNLLKDEDLSVGRFDGRYTGEDDFTEGTYPDNDPSGYGMDVAYTAALNDYFSRDLRLGWVGFDEEYKILSGEPGSNWKWFANPASGSGYPDPTPMLAKGLRENKDLRVMVTSGYYDLATPFFSSELSLYRNGVDPDRVTFTYYEAGHMMYLRADESEALSEDIRDFIRAGKRD